MVGVYLYGRIDVCCSSGIDYICFVLQIQVNPNSLVKDLYPGIRVVAFNYNRVRFTKAEDMSVTS
jgi:hypothetical protein